MASTYCMGQHKLQIFFEETPVFSLLPPPSLSPSNYGLMRKQLIPIHLRTLCPLASKPAGSPQELKRLPAPTLWSGKNLGELMKVQRNPPPSPSENPLLKGFYHKTECSDSTWIFPVTYDNDSHSAFLNSHYILSGFLHSMKSKKKDWWGGVFL